MTPFEEDVLWQALHKAQSWRLLHDPQTGGQYNAEQVLELAKDAGYGEEMAQKMASQTAWERMKREQSP